MMIHSVSKFCAYAFPGQRFEVVVRGQHCKHHHGKFTDQGIIYPITDVVPRFELVVGKLKDASGQKKSHREAFINVWYQDEFRTLQTVIDFLRHEELDKSRSGGGYVSLWYERELRFAMHMMNPVKMIGGRGQHAVQDQNRMVPLDLTDIEK